MPIYIDTSALIKRYLSERSSAEFDAFVADVDDALQITALTITEFHSVVGRRLRSKEFDAAFAAETRRCLDDDLLHALWQVQPFPLQAFTGAQRLIQDRRSALATLDALHLACALEFGSQAIATADVQMARAAQLRGLTVHSFA